MKMNRRVELPLTAPMYSTFNNQGPAVAIAVNNPTAKNRYLNQVMNLTCKRSFLHGYSSPDIFVADSGWYHNEYIEKHWVSAKFVGGYLNPIIRNMIDNGYYVAYNDVDDYYVKGKSWYHKHHFGHDGLICGYDQSDKTYCIYAYDSNWIYQKFWTPQSAFQRGRIAVEKQGRYSNICAISMSDAPIAFSPVTVCEKLREYLDSDLKKYPFDGEGDVYGIVVHTYLAKYMAMLYCGEIPYERTDTRIFRLIWEHKKIMHERLELLEKTLDLKDHVSRKYEPLVKEADTIRLLYAAHCLKRRDAVLPLIEKKLLNMENTERALLNEALNNAERAIDGQERSIEK